MNGLRESGRADSESQKNFDQWKCLEYIEICYFVLREHIKKYLISFCMFKRLPILRCKRLCYQRLLSAFHSELGVVGNVVFKITANGDGTGSRRPCP
jgi:hypothetical protein